MLENKSMNNSQEWLYLPDEASMLALGVKLAHEAKAGDVIYLKGPLGAGKTTLSRGFLQGLGYKGPVKSPTYTLVEPYVLKFHTVYHFDLYRIQSPEELSFMGLEDYFNAQAICLIEWPEKGGGYLPKATLSCEIQLIINSKGREVTLQLAANAIPP